MASDWDSTETESGLAPQGAPPGPTAPGTEGAPHNAPSDAPMDMVTKRQAYLKKHSIGEGEQVYILSL